MDRVNNEDASVRRAPQPGDAVLYFNEYGKQFNAICTANHGSQSNPTPAINLVYVSDDAAMKDPYGRQILRETSTVHSDNQSAHGRYWMHVLV